MRNIRLSSLRWLAAGAVLATVGLSQGAQAAPTAGVVAVPASVSAPVQAVQYHRHYRRCFWRHHHRICR